MTRKTLSDRGVAALKPRAKPYVFPDPELRGHGIRVLPSGVRSFQIIARGPAPDRKQVWKAIDDAGIGIVAAREQAREMLRRVRSGLPAVEPKGETFAAIVANWRKRYVEKNDLRSANEINRLLNVHILPVWGNREMPSIRKSDIAALLDHVEDKHGARQADHCLSVWSRIANWHAARDDTYSPPLLRGMRRQSPHAQRRSRVLADDEMRKIWLAAGTAGTYGALVRMLLLTAQRRDKVLTMAWADLLENRSVWKIATESPREKPHGGLLKLPALARDILANLPIFDRNPFVFAGLKGYINGHSKAKAHLDAAAGVTGWTLHDLRRTARTLMSRAKVDPDIAERTLGHALPGIRGTYDWYGYVDEKADALAKLAALISDIVAPSDKVVAISKGSRRR